MSPLRWLIVFLLVTVPAVRADDSPVKLEDPKNTLKGHTEPLDRLVFSPDGAKVYSVDLGTTLKSWDVAKGAVECDIREMPRRLPGGKLWLTRKSSLLIVDENMTQVGKALNWVEEKGRRFTGRLAVSPDRKTSIAIDENGNAYRLVFWDLESGVVSDGPKAKDHELSSFNEVGFFADGKSFWTKSQGKFTIWKATVAKPTSKWELPKELGNGDDWLVDSTGAVIALRTENKVSFIDLQTGKEKGAIQVKHEKAITCWSLSEDGKWVATGGDDHLARVWDAKTGKELVTIEAHRGAVTCVAFARDGKTLATGSEDKTIKLWDLEKALGGNKDK